MKSKKRPSRNQYHRQHQKWWRYSSVERFVKNKLRQASKRAERQGVQFTLTAKQVLGLLAKQKGRCALTQWVMTHDRGHMNTTNISIDRIKPGRGYTPRNCRLVCESVNTARWAMGDLPFVKMCSAIAANYIAQNV